jgi:hypothetical protein
VCVRACVDVCVCSNNKGLVVSNRPIGVRAKVCVCVTVYASSECVCVRERER